MKAFVLDRVVDLSVMRQPLSMTAMEIPEPGEDEVLLRVLACGACHTELDEIEGRTPPPRFPVVPGHQVVGEVVARGRGVDRPETGERVGVAWIYSSCGECELCQQRKENLCADFRGTGRDAHGGYAEYMVAKADYVYPLPDCFSNEEAAPLLCAGAVGYRALKLLNVSNGQALGLTGFGASAHLVLKIARFLYPDSLVHVFARNPVERDFALKLGAVWAGDTTDASPLPLVGVIDTTPVWLPGIAALENLSPGGRLVINAIRKESADIDALAKLNYVKHLWMEKEVKSVANITRADVREFLQIAEAMALRPEVQVYRFEEANRALLDIKERRIRGAKVLRIA
ncbi:alcohol dehydrogenase [Prosthecochloris sp. GSB1]|uniref:zinc-dependent alcohol dehydrogenase family protein n=1 Tax=Prosthecochloris sp. GSB1 TaxID=281093 RepID=UPI000B8CFCF8|nr:alcohol dehydrogenase [Prosthecochloris sp. GSB1]